MGRCNKSIKELPLPVLVYNVLLNGRVDLISHLLDMTTGDLFRLRGMGKISIADIIIALEGIGEKLKAGVKDIHLDKIVKKRKKVWVKQGWFN